MGRLLALFLRHPCTLISRLRGPRRPPIISQDRRASAEKSALPLLLKRSSMLRRLSVKPIASAAFMGDAAPELADGSPPVYQSRDDPVGKILNQAPHEPDQNQRGSTPVCFEAPDVAASSP